MNKKAEKALITQTIHNYLKCSWQDSLDEISEGLAQALLDEGVQILEQSEPTVKNYLVAFSVLEEKGDTASYVGCDSLQIEATSQAEAMQKVQERFVNPHYRATIIAITRLEQGE